VEVRELAHECRRRADRRPVRSLPGELDVALQDARLVLGPTQRSSTVPPSASLAGKYGLRPIAYSEVDVRVATVSLRTAGITVHPKVLELAHAFAHQSFENVSPALATQGGMWAPPTPRSIN
jgi:hypothetical protein